MYFFVNNNSIIYNLQVGFRQCSTSHALINISENIRKAPDDENIGFRVFMDLQKTYNTVDNQILFQLNHYAIWAVSNDKSKSLHKK